ncbi:unnamed protein product, partial [Ilex paraguariensis]
LTMYKLSGVVPLPDSSKRALTWTFWLFRANHHRLFKDRVYLLLLQKHATILRHPMSNKSPYYFSPVPPLPPVAHVKFPESVVLECLPLILLLFFLPAMPRLPLDCFLLYQQDQS